jgi:hypothetical protein
MFKTYLGVASLLALSACAMAVPSDDDNIETQESDLTSELAPNGKQKGTNKASGAGGGGGMVYHGGPIMLGTTKAYYIWYGNWAGNTAQPILTDLATNIGGSPHFNINTTYYNSSFTRVSNSVAFGGSTVDSYSQGAALSDNGVWSVVASALASNALPTDPHGVYFVLTSADVDETSGFCTKYCGWHYYDGPSGIKYSFVGNAARCPSACAAQTTKSPNGNVGADAMASVLVHELEEAVTDPYLNAWYDRRGYENADKCAWTFGATYVANGAAANMKLGTRHYLIQQNWVNVGAGKCALKY